MMILGSKSLLAPSLLQLPGICPALPGAAPGNGVRDAVRGPCSRAVAKITEVKQTPSNYGSSHFGECPGAVGSRLG